MMPGYFGAHEKAKLSSSPKQEMQNLRTPTPSHSGRLSLGSARDSNTVNLAGEIYKVDAANKIELSKILWEVRFLQNPEEMERQLQVIDAAVLAQVHLCSVHRLLTVVCFIPLLNAYC